MKRIGKLILLLMFLALTGAESVWGAGQVTMYVKTEGTDYYGNGDLAEVGAPYAIVWVKDGATFHFQADGTWDQVPGCELLGMVKTYYEGCCAFKNKNGSKTRFQLQLDSSAMNKYVGGSFELHLLDTRHLDMTATESGVGSQTPGQPVLINVATKVASVPVADVKSGESNVFTVLETPMYDISLVPEEAPQPLITSCRLVTVGEEKFFELKIKRTVRYLNYNIARVNEFPVSAKTNNVDRIEPIDGSPTSNLEEERTIRIPLAGNENCGFFKVIRHQPISLEKAGVTP